MTRPRAVWLVARRELLERGRSRAFLFSVGFTIFLILAGILVPALIGSERTDRVGVVGTPPANFGLTLAAAAAQANLEVRVEPLPDVATGEARLEDGSLSGVLVVPDEAGVSPTYVVRQAGNALLTQVVAGAWAASRVQELLRDAGIGSTEFTQAATPPTVRELVPADPNRETSFIFANVGVILLFISIFTFGIWVLTGVVEEKQSRVVEVVLSTVEPRDLLAGKVLGIGLLGLIQLVIMVTVGLSVALAAGRITLPPTTGGAVLQLLLWFVLGYALYSTALGVLGALASRMEEASNASSPVTFLAVGAYMFSLFVVVDDPSGLPARVASLIPPVAPMVVPLRAALGAIEPWETALSAVLTIAAIWGLFVVGGRVYAGAVLRTGGRLGVREAWRAARE